MSSKVSSKVSSKIKVANIQKEYINTLSECIIYKGIETRQLGDLQDHVDCGNYTNIVGYRVDWIVVIDGHGNNSCIEAIKESNMSSIMESVNPATALNNIVLADKTTTDSNKLASGATFIAARLTQTKFNIEVEIFHVGDSTGIIFVNDKQIYITKPQNSSHSKQMLHLVEKGIILSNDAIHEDGLGFDVINHNTLLSRKNSYVKLLTKYSSSGSIYMGPSNSLGHLDLYGNTLYVDIIHYTFLKTDNIKILLMSDGVTDVINVGHDKIFNNAKSSTAILNEAEYRWKQRWSYILDNNFADLHESCFPKNGYDDCSVSIIEYKPLLLDKHVFVSREIFEQELQLNETMNHCSYSI